MDANQTCCCPPPPSQSSFIISVTGLVVSAVSFMLAILTFFSNLWRLYADNEWKKAYAEVDLDKEYTPAAEAAGKVYAIQQDVAKLNLKSTQDASSSSDKLDYADVYFMYRSLGALPEGIKDQLRMQDCPTEQLKTWTEELETSRLKAAAFWNRAAGMCECHQLLPKYSTICGRLRACVRLPTKAFLGRKWGGRGSRHQELVEPLDIANWYSMRPFQKEQYCDATEVRPPRYALISEVKSLGQSEEEDTKNLSERRQWERYQREKKKCAPQKKKEMEAEAKAQEPKQAGHQAV